MEMRTSGHRGIFPCHPTRATRFRVMQLVLDGGHVYYPQHDYHSSRRAQGIRVVNCARGARRPLFCCAQIHPVAARTAGWLTESVTGKEWIAGWLEPLGVTLQRHDGPGLASSPRLPVSYFIRSCPLPTFP